MVAIRSVKSKRTATGAALLLCLLAAAMPVAAMPPQPQGDPQRWDGYFEGLRAIRAGQWTQAIAPLSEAARRGPADGRVFLARAVAYALAGEFGRAEADLRRAQVGGSREPQLWDYAVQAMTGNTRAGYGIQVPRSLQKQAGSPEVFSGIPGHLIQGGADYPTAYASCVFYELAMPFRSAREAGASTASPRLLAARQKAGKWFANRALATDALSSRNFDWAQQLVRDRDLTGARQVLDIARSVRPFDADILTLSGDLWNWVGRPATARREYTIALTTDTTHVSAYAGRALAAAALGDSRRAGADLERVAQYAGAAPATKLKAAVQQTLAKSSASAEPAALLAQLDRAAGAGADVDRLLPIAERLRRVLGERRLRYDELYQDRLRQLEGAVRAHPKNLEARVALAQYLVDEVDSRGETVEPRRGVAPFRWQYSRGWELERALRQADEALGIDPNHPSALVTKAYVLAALDRDQAAEALLTRALQIGGPNDPQAARLLAEYRSRQVGQLLAGAAALRSPTYSSSSHTEHRSDGVWEVTTTYRHDPTRADLQNADAMEARALALMRQTRAIMEAAIRASGGTLEGLLLESSYQNWFGTRARARALLQQAVRQYPQSLKAHDHLIAYLRFLGRHDQVREQQVVSWQLFQTSCAPLLQKVWEDVRRRGWAALTGDLGRARELDPSDARATAYLAAAQAALGQPAQANALYRVALALEQARIDLDDRGSGRSWPRPAGDLALSMRLHHLLAAADGAAGNAASAFEHFQTSAALAERFPPDGVAALMFGAMLPDPSGPAIPVPAPLNGATMAAEAYVGAGRALQASGRSQEAQRFFQRAAALTRQYGDQTPNVGTARGDTNFGGLAGQPSATALIELARTDIQNRQYRAAFEKLQASTQASPTREQRQQINEMIKDLLPHLNR